MKSRRNSALVSMLAARRFGSAVWPGSCRAGQPRSRPRVIAAPRVRRASSRRRWPGWEPADEPARPTSAADQLPGSAPSWRVQRLSRCEFPTSERRAHRSRCTALPHATPVDRGLARTHRTPRSTTPTASSGGGRRWRWVDCTRASAACRRRAIQPLRSLVHHLPELYPDHAASLDELLDEWVVDHLLRMARR